MVLVLGLVGPLQAAPLRQGDCQPLAFGETVTGTISADAPEVCYTISPAIEQRFYIEMRATDGDLDPALQLLGMANMLMASNDNASDDTTDALIENYMQTMPGDLTIVATSANDTTGSFELRASLYAETIVPATAPAEVAALGQPVSGAVTADAPRVFFEYTLDTSGVLMLSAEASAEWTPHLALHRVSGEFSVEIAAMDAARPGGKAALGPVFVQPGIIRVEVAAADGSDPGEFSLLVAEPDPLMDGSAITYGDFVAGELGGAPDTQHFTFDGMAGDAITLRMTPLLDFGAQMRANVEVRLGEGEPLVTSQNAYHPEIALLLLPEDGQYTVTVNSFSSAGPYSLFLDQLAAGVEPYDVPVNEIALNDIVTGEIGLLEYAQAYRFEIEAG
ncbi:MAG: hypothetical protein GYB65_04415, partial [Chloroflexi bacterium]|nr:hypothetical protein [Chloroflexota bacterium]